jgi:hypothetical protein
MKGVMTPEFPMKIELLKQQHPSVFSRYRICFQDSSLVIPGRKCSYAQWATELDLPFKDVGKKGSIPASWFLPLDQQEKPPTHAERLRKTFLANLDLIK